MAPPSIPWLACHHLLFESSRRPMREDFPESKYCASSTQHQTTQAFDEHVAWHGKFRQFFKLREGAGAQFLAINPSTEQVQSALQTLTKLWNQVSPPSDFSGSALL